MYPYVISKSLFYFLSPLSTRAKVNQVYGPTKGKEEGEIHKVLGPRLRGFGEGNDEVLAQSRKGIRE